MTSDGKPFVADFLHGGVIDFAANQGTAIGSAAVSPEGSFAVHLEPGEYDVAVRDNGGHREGGPLRKRRAA